ncbi:MAG: LacI family transcriptional regulator [Chloroflexi bacterium]|nr:LacI family transcriptional regulator [Chloroflexota bacterium]
MPLTLEDIARISGVSRSTVSRVINDEPNVSESTREKVLEVIQKINFQPNLAARGLAVGKTRVLGMVIPTGVTSLFTDPFFPLLIQGVSSACNSLDYSVMLWLAEPEFERRTIRQILYSGLIDGVIISSALNDDPIINSLAESRLPFVLIGRHLSNQQISYVDVDNRIGAQQAVLHLIRNGRKRIGTIAGPQNVIAGIDRYQGYLDALHERGITVDPDLTTFGDFTDPGGYACMRRLLEYNPDGVFAASDSMALGAMRAIHDTGLKIPEDIAVIGFDDIPQASQSLPTLTTVRQPIIREGMLAAETLIGMIEGSPEPPRHIILPTELVIRDSCDFHKGQPLRKEVILLQKQRDR